MAPMPCSASHDHLPDEDTGVTGRNHRTLSFSGQAGRVLQAVHPPPCWSELGTLYPHDKLPELEEEGGSGLCKPLAFPKPGPLSWTT